MLKEIALESERYGFSSILINDHFFPFPRCSHMSFLECWTTLASLSVETQKIRIGPHVLCYSYRHPSVVAKMAATLDVISNGRLELGVGAGWVKAEHEAYGLSFSPMKIRVNQLVEYLEILKKMWIEQNSSFEGTYYSIKNAINEPKPVQKPHPPLSIGTRIGGDRMLNVIARFADIWNFSSMPTPNEFRNELQRLKKMCLKQGRDLAEIENSVDIFVLPDTDKKYIQKNMRNFGGLFKDRGIIGSPKHCIKKIEEFISVGVSYFIFYFPNFTDMRVLTQIGEEIIPVLKDR